MGQNWEFLQNLLCQNYPNLFTNAFTAHSSFQFSNQRYKNELFSLKVSWWNIAKFTKHIIAYLIGCWTTVKLFAFSISKLLKQNISAIQRAYIDRSMLGPRISAAFQQLKNGRYLPLNEQLPKYRPKRAILRTRTWWHDAAASETMHKPYRRVFALRCFEDECTPSRSAILATRTFAEPFVDSRDCCCTTTSYPRETVSSPPEADRSVWIDALEWQPLWESLKTKRAKIALLNQRKFGTHWDSPAGNATLAPDV